MTSSICQRARQRREVLLRRIPLALGGAIDREDDCQQVKLDLLAVIFTVNRAAKRQRDSAEKHFPTLPSSLADRASHPVQSP